MSIKIDLREVNKLFSNFQLNPTLLDEISLDVSNSIANRVQEQGKGPNNNRLRNTERKTYSTPYKKFRLKKGYKADKRYLTATGKMFQALTVIGNNNEKIITFLGTSARDKAMWNEKQSPFFSIGKLENKVIDDGLIRHLNSL